jgi:hypothetical protein
METNYYEDKEKQAENMVNEEYFHEFSGCLWGAISILIAFAIVGCVILFT